MTMDFRLARPSRSNGGNVSRTETAEAIWTARMLSVLRIVAAILFIEHGTNKIFGWPPTGRAPVAYVLPSLLGVAGIVETFGGLLLLIGLFTRPVAFLAAGEMAVAYFKVHIVRSIFPIANGGDNVALFCFFYLYLVFAGAGPWSLDAIIARRGATTFLEGHERTPLHPRRVDLEDRRRDTV
jgi:putative oxidoreductase